jgi:hypothetical protein
VKLTPAGEQVFCTVFPEVISQSGKMFAGFSEDDFAQLEKPCRRLKLSSWPGKRARRPPMNAIKKPRKQI